MNAFLLIPLESIWNLSFIDSPLKRKKIPIKKDIDHRATVVSKRRVELRSLKERKNDKWSSKQVLKHKNVPLCLPACLGQASTHRDLQPANCPAAQTRPRLPTQFQAAQSWSNAWVFDGHSWIWKGLLTSSPLTLFCLTVCCSTSLLTYLLTCRIPCLCDTSYRVLNKNYQHIF